MCKQEYSRERGKTLEEVTSDKDTQDRKLWR